VCVSGGGVFMINTQRDQDFLVINKFNCKECICFDNKEEGVLNIEAIHRFAPNSVSPRQLFPKAIPSRNNRPNYVKW